MLSGCAVLGFKGLISRFYKLQPQKPYRPQRILVPWIQFQFLTTDIHEK